MLRICMRKQSRSVSQSCHSIRIFHFAACYVKYQNQNSEYYGFTSYLCTMLVPHGNRLSVWEQRIMEIFSHVEEEVAMNVSY